MKTSAGLIIGIGNPLRGDDGFGYLAAESLAKKLKNTPVKVVATHQLLPEHLDLMRKVAWVVFIDASAAGEAGKLTITTPRALFESPLAFSHSLDVTHMMAWCKSLYRVCPKTLLLSTGIADDRVGMPFSPGVRRALTKAVSLVVKLINVGNPSVEAYIDNLSRD
ncbi:MAG TPA: hydrogenase maturation protease [Calditrichia bacterium]|nr:hydrogenase maturation protease [Calditrichota bacterium]HQU70795.1 hydrogenase maturation protease [Calditrichia bacterium]HQV31184.1 hydrogenase maturation protease [Calditrichia bacterium]